MTQARQILLALLLEEVAFHPVGEGCRFTGKASVGSTLSGFALFNGLGAGGGDRTRTGVSPHGILSPGRLPIPPPRHEAGF